MTTVTVVIVVTIVRVDKNKHVYKNLQYAFLGSDAVCSKYCFSLTNEYPNVFVSAKYSQMNVQIYLVDYIFTNECSNIFILVVLLRMNLQIYLKNKY